jgi:hypothetical protein
VNTPEKPPRRRWWQKKRWWAAALVIVSPVSYAVSLGPVRYCNCRGWVSPKAEVVAYSPMFWGAPLYGGPPPWWPGWYREYIDECRAAGIEAYTGRGF